ncbi:hypothetical protein C0995_009767 [Termitomyces sp. Mi166|nr:hypothetical protein C0995_009767 [Termitomyces sp. Mi166\
MLVQQKRRSRFSQTVSAINTIIIYTINTGFIPSVSSLITAIMYGIWPTTPIYLAVFFPLSKLHFACLLAALNNLEAIWERCFGGGIMTGTNSSSGINFSAPPQDPCLTGA